MEYFPEPILRRIQSFLTGKEAARTSILSKSWRSAWLTRPDLDFDEQDHSGIVKFLIVVTKCINRYVKSNLKIQSFSLSMKHSADLAANKFIVKALEIGATRLTLQMSTDKNKEFVIPDEVFASENLVELSAEGCKIRDDYCPSNVRCWRLQSLTLDRVPVSNNVIAHIISRCQYSIEKLVLSDNTKYRETQDMGTAASKMPNLRSLLLSQEKFRTLFSGDVSSSKLPALKDLTVLEYSQRVGEDAPVKISNHSLEKLNFSATGYSLKVEFDVPSMRKFTYRGNLVTSLSFKSTSREWESHVSIMENSPGISWFYGLNKLLTGFSLLPTTIYLSLDLHDRSCSFDYDFEDVEGLPKPRVENLTMDMIVVPSLSCYALFDGLFKICRPKFFTQYLVPESSVGWKTNNHLLCKELVRKTCKKRKRGIQSFPMYSLDDLKEAGLRIWDEDDGEWHEVVPLEALLDAPAPTKKQKIQFRLGWDGNRHG